jgi:hypothetical protein
MTRTHVLVAALAVAGAIAAFTTALTRGANDPSHASVDLASPVRQEPIPDPGSDAVLRIDGRISNVNHGRELRLSDRVLAGMASTTVTLYEPFKERRMRFEAIELRDVLRRASVTDGASSLYAVALNDYTVDIPLDVAASPRVYLAVRNGDGSRIQVEEGGPIRIVFADGAHGAGTENYWIWSLASLSVR